MECTSEDAAVIDMINDTDGDDNQKKKSKNNLDRKEKEVPLRGIEPRSARI